MPKPVNLSQKNHLLWAVGATRKSDMSENINNFLYHCIVAITLMINEKFVGSFSSNFTN